MASRTKFSNEDIQAIQDARRKNQNKRVEARLYALQLSAEGKKREEIAAVTGFHPAYISQIVTKYRKHGLEALTENHYGGNHRNMSFEEEAEILRPFQEKAAKGEAVEVKKIAEAYAAALGRKVGIRQIYFVLHRHGWRKAVPRSKQPKKVSEEAASDSQKE